MKIRKVRVGIKDFKSALGEFVETGRAIEEGKPVTKQKGVYFTSAEAFRKAITPKRLALLRMIRTQQPTSVRHLSKLSKRDVKNVATDVKFLEQAGLIGVEKDESKEKEVRPVVRYDKILFEIAVS